MNIQCELDTNLGCYKPLILDDLITVQDRFHLQNQLIDADVNSQMCKYEGDKGTIHIPVVK